MRTKTVKTLLPLSPTEAWDALVAPPSGFETEDRNWLEYYEVQLTRWSETFSSMGWLLTGNIPDDMRWTLG